MCSRELIFGTSIWLLMKAVRRAINETKSQMVEVIRKWHVSLSRFLKMITRNTKLNMRPKVMSKGSETHEKSSHFVDK
jgi:hypothetical protein